MQTSSRLPRKWTLVEDQKLREEVELQLIEGGDVKDWCKIASKLHGRTNKDCRKRWHNSVAGGLKKGQWSKSEDALLARGVQEHGQRWTLVANCVESRSADQCAKRWQQSLDPELDRSEWRDEEDQSLIEATQQLGRHWKDIQRDYFPGRSKNCIKNRYTVLVRRYQNQGITLPSRASSPSEASAPTPLSMYPPDNEYSPFFPNDYNSLMPPQTRGTSVGSRHHSWSSFDSEGMSAWSSSQDYTVPMVATEMTHATSPIPDYAFTAPQTLASNDYDWNWTPNPSAPMQAPSPVSYSTHPAPRHYDDYALAQPPAMSTSSRSTARATYPGMTGVPTSVPAQRTRAWSGHEQQQYDSLAPTSTYLDPRLHQQDPLYRF